MSISIVEERKSLVVRIDYSDFPQWESSFRKIESVYTLYYRGFKFAVNDYPKYEQYPGVTELLTGMNVLVVKNATPSKRSINKIAQATKDIVDSKWGIFKPCLVKSLVTNVNHNAIICLL